MKKTISLPIAIIIIVACAGLAGWITITYYLEMPAGEEKITPAIPEKSILIFVDESTYQQLTNEINRLADDIKNDLGINVSIQHTNYTSPVQIRKIIKDYYQNKGSLGSILIGDIPTFYTEDGFFYTDWFYQELSDRCIINSDGQFKESDTENCKPVDAITKADVFVGRIKPPIGGPEGTTLIKKYLDKNHAYRIGKISFNKRMLVYPNISIYEMGISPDRLNINLDRAILKLHIYSRDQINLITTNDPIKAKQEYLQKLTESHEIALINTHGSPTSQQIKGNVRITFDDIKDAAPNIFFVELLSCSTGSFQKQNYFAGWFLFTGNTLIVRAASAWIASPDLLPDPPVEPIFFTRLSTLKLGILIGQMSRRDNSQAVHTFGDPTLKMRSISLDGPKIIASDKLDFGEVAGGDSKSLIYTIQNKGDETLELRRTYDGGFTIDGKFSFDINNPTEPASDLNFNGFTIVPETPYYSAITIEPGEKKDIIISFAPAVYRKTKLTQTGRYFDIMYFQTNDPARPYLEIQLFGTGAAST